MKANNFAVRTVTAVVGLGVFALLVFVLPHQRHLAFNAALTAAAVLGGLEMEGLLRARGVPAWRCTAVGAGLLPAAAWLEIRGLLAGGWWAALAMGMSAACLLPGLWATPSRPQHLAAALPRSASSLLVVLYPGLLLSFVVRLTGLPRPSLVLALFFALVFVNDILAYLAGTYLGAGSRLNYAVSPNKSAVGFAAGLIGAIGVAMGFKAVFPELLPISYAWAAVFGGLMGALTICGDLVESVLKRSAGVKDSGLLIPGRGGVLDSLDSWLLGAPVFYAVMRSLNQSPTA